MRSELLPLAVPPTPPKRAEPDDPRVYRQRFAVSGGEGWVQPAGGVEGVRGGVEGGVVGDCVFEGVDDGAGGDDVAVVYVILLGLEFVRDPPWDCRAPAEALLEECAEDREVLHVGDFWEAVAATNGIDLLLDLAVPVREQNSSADKGLHWRRDGKDGGDGEHANREGTFIKVLDRPLASGFQEGAHVGRPSTSIHHLLLDLQHVLDEPGTLHVVPLFLGTLPWVAGVWKPQKKGDEVGEEAGGGDVHQQVPCITLKTFEVVRRTPGEAADNARRHVLCETSPVRAVLHHAEKKTFRLDGWIVVVGVLGCSNNANVIELLMALVIICSMLESFEVSQGEKGRTKHLLFLDIKGRYSAVPWWLCESSTVGMLGRPE